MGLDIIALAWAETRSRDIARDREIHRVRERERFVQLSSTCDVATPSCVSCDGIKAKGMM